MQNSAPPEGTQAQDEWVVWNASAGILLTAALGQIELREEGRVAWLARPFDIVGPFSLDELQSKGRIAFAACLVMSRQRWQADQSVLRREAYEARRATQQRFEEQEARFSAGRAAYAAQRRRSDDKQHREALSLPIVGKLEAAQIKAAFRRLAQKAHPDVGGSHEQFVRITEARDALLGRGV